MVSSDGSRAAKEAAALHSENAGTRQHDGSTQDEIRQVDDLATNPATTLESFKHIDEKKVLRKVG